MHQILSIVSLQFRQVMKNPATIIAFFGMPLLFVMIFGLASGGSSESAKHKVYPIAVVDADQSFASQRLTDALGKVELMNVQVVSEDGVNRLTADKKVVSVVRIPAGFHKSLVAGTPVDVATTSTPGSNAQLAVAPAISREVSRVSQDLRLASFTAGQDEVKLKATFDKLTTDRRSAGASVSTEQLRREGADAVKSNGASDMSVGFTVLFVMMLVMIMSGTILEERRDGTWARLLTTPAGKVNVVTGYVLSFFVTGFAQFTTLVVITSLVFKVQWGPLPQLFLMAALFVLCASAIGLFMAGIVKTPEQQRVVAIAFTSSTSMLGGVYWSLDFVGDTMRRIGYLTPQAWAMDGFREVMLRGGSLQGMMYPMIVLGALSVIFMTAGILRVKYE